jgi:nucleotide-binding universal stress UspA family protein
MKAVQARTRIALKNVLFATDFSKAADAAAPFAIQIAGSFGAKVYGLYVNPIDGYTTAPPEAWAVMAEAAERQTKEHARRLDEQLKGVEHEVVMGEGNVGEVVTRVVKEKKIDLIVLGTRGRTGLGKALLGSVAEQILRQAPCPVLTVGPHVTPRPYVNGQHEESAKLREILFATDLAADFPVAAPYAISLAQENQARLVLLHVMEEPEERGDFAETQVDKLRQLVPQDAELWCEPHYLVEQGIPAEKILQIADARNADLIVLGAHPARWLAAHVNAGAVHKVVSEAKCPVLTVHG